MKIWPLVLCLLVLSGCAVNPVTLDSPLQNGAIGEGLGVQIKPPRVTDKDFNRIVDMGFSYVRTGISWSAVEKIKGSYDWQEYDKLFSSIRAHGLKAVITLTNGNRLYGGMVAAPKNPFGAKKVEVAPASDEAQKAFAEFAVAAVKRYGTEGIIWAIWNEPDISIFWPPKSDASAYVALAGKTCNAIRAVAPNAVITAPALAYMPGMPEAGKSEFLKKLLKSSAIDCIDSISVHPYRAGKEPPETVSDEYTKLREFIAQYAPIGRKDMPIISNEWGYSTTQVSDEQQAAYAVREHIANLLNGVSISIWYEWSNSGRDKKNREHNFGLLDKDGNLNASGKAIADILPQIKNAVIEKRIDEGDPKIYALVLRFPDGTRRILSWIAESDAKSATINSLAVNGEGGNYTLSIQPRLMSYAYEK